MDRPNQDDSGTTSTPDRGTDAPARRADTRERDVTVAYSELARITRRATVRARGPESALSLVDHSLVEFIDRHHGCMAIDIARELHLNRSTISRQLAGLFAHAYIETIDGGTGNAKPLGVTEAGRTALARSRRAHRNSLEVRLAGWSDDDIRQLADLLQRFNAGGDLPEI